MTNPADSIATERPPWQVVVGVGANLGSPRDTMAELAAEMTAAPWINRLAASSLYMTSPVGGPPQPDYVNAVIVVDSQVAPDRVLVYLQQWEQQFGRKRSVRWGPRTLDLDIVDAHRGEQSYVHQEPDLVIPHPRALGRAFVLVPWAEVASGWVVSGTDATVEQWRRRLPVHALDDVRRLASE